MEIRYHVSRWGLYDFSTKYRRIQFVSLSDIKIIIHILLSIPFLFKTLTLGKFDLLIRKPENKKSRLVVSSFTSSHRSMAKEIPLTTKVQK
jgi:hypothetical protein